MTTETSPLRFRDSLQEDLRLLSRADVRQWLHEQGHHEVLRRLEDPRWATADPWTLNAVGWIRWYFRQPIEPNFVINEGNATLMTIIGIQGVPPEMTFTIRNDGRYLVPMGSGWCRIAFDPPIERVDVQAMDERTVELEVSFNSGMRIQPGGIYWCNLRIDLGLERRMLDVVLRAEHEDANAPAPSLQALFQKHQRNHKAANRALQNPSTDAWLAQRGVSEDLLRFVREAKVPDKLGLLLQLCGFSELHPTSLMTHGLPQHLLTYIEEISCNGSNYRMLTWDEQRSRPCDALAFGNWGSKYGISFIDYNGRARARRSMMHDTHLPSEKLTHLKGESLENATELALFSGQKVRLPIQATVPLHAVIDNSLVRYSFRRGKHILLCSRGSSARCVVVRLIHIEGGKVYGTSCWAVTRRNGPWRTLCTDAARFFQHAASRLGIGRAGRQA